VDHPDNETMEVLVSVAFPKLRTQASEDAWEEDILNAVAAALAADKTLEKGIVQVDLLDGLGGQIDVQAFAEVA